ncbi:MAG: phosphate ABC transporter substrate-binding protein PstS [Acidimicrobiales bacterium]
MTRKLRAKQLIPTVAVTLGVAVGLAACSSTSPSASKTSAKTTTTATKTTGSTGSTSTSTASTVKTIKVEKPATATIAEAGSSLLYPLWNIWVPGYNQTYPKVTVQTAAGGSGKGISGAMNGTLQIGSSDAYLSTADKQQKPTMLNIPLAISAQQIYYNIPNVSAHLKLNGKILAGMYTGKITKWSTSAITSINPGLTLPTLPVVTLHRADGSGDTFLFTSYLSKTTKTWSTKFGFNTTVTWPAAPGALAETGNSGMVAGCKATPGCVAYIGISYQTQALGAALAYASMENGAGKYVLPTATTIQAEANGYTAKTPATGAISMIDGTGGYPIINYEYGVVSKKQSSTTEAKAVRSLLEWAISPKDGNSNTYMSQVGFRPLPTKVIKQSYTQIKSIK